MSQAKHLRKTQQKQDGVSGCQCEIGWDANISLCSVLFLDCQDKETHCSAICLMKLAAISGKPFGRYCLSVGQNF